MDMNAGPKYVGNEYMPHAVMLIAFCGYVMTCHPLITAGDSGELAAAAWTLGIGHPPGSPLYALAARAASLIPIGNPAFRMTAMSCALVGLALSFAYRLISAVTEDADPLAVSAVVLMAGAVPVVWGSTAYIEVYAMSTFMSVSALYLAALSDIRADFRHAYASLFIIGLGTGGHYLTLLALPGVAVLVLPGAAEKNTLKRMSVSAASLAAGLSVWLYLPVRSHAAPALDWGNPEHFRTFISAILRAEYGDMGALIGRFWMVVAALGVFVGAAVVAYRLVRAYAGDVRTHKYLVMLLSVISMVAMAVAVIGMSGTSARLSGFLGFSVSGGWAWLGVLALAGIVYLYRCRYAVASGALVNALVLVSLTLVVYQPDGRLFLSPLMEKLMLPLVVILCVPAGVFVGQIPGMIDKLSFKYKGIATLARYLLVLISAVVFARGALSNDRARLVDEYRIIKGVYAGIAPGGVLVVDGDSMIFLGKYMKEVEDIRPDVDIYGTNGNVFEHAGNAEGYFRRGTRPAYRTGRPDVYGPVKDGLAPYGMLRALPAWASADAWSYYDVDTDTAPGPGTEFHQRQLKADYLVARAADLVTDDPASADRLIGEALSVAGDQLWTYRAAAWLHIRRGEYRKALAVLEDALAFGGRNYAVNLMYAGCLLDSGQPVRAEKMYRRAIGLAPGQSGGYIGLAFLLAGEGDRRGAVDVLEKGYAKVGIEGRVEISDAIKVIGGGT